MTVSTQIPKGTNLNFQTIIDAALGDRVILLRAYDTVTQQDVTLLCALNYKGEDYEFVPLAIMIEENPFERYVPPT